MDPYEKLKNMLLPRVISLNEDSKKRKKKKRKKGKNLEDDMLISFKPLGVCKLKDSQDSKQTPIPMEEEFCNKCPVKFYPIQIEAIRWMYWIEISKKKNDIQVGGILGILITNP